MDISRRLRGTSERERFGGHPLSADLHRKTHPLVVGLPRRRVGDEERELPAHRPAPPRHRASRGERSAGCGRDFDAGNAPRIVPGREREAQAARLAAFQFERLRREGDFERLAGTFVRVRTAGSQERQQGRRDPEHSIDMHLHSFHRHNNLFPPPCRRPAPSRCRS